MLNSNIIIKTNEQNILIVYRHQVDHYYTFSCLNGRKKAIKDINSMLLTIKILKVFFPMFIEYKFSKNPSNNFQFSLIDGFKEMNIQNITIKIRS